MFKQAFRGYAKAKGPDDPVTQDAKRLFEEMSQHTERRNAGEQGNQTGILSI
jgi:hypothetical protein